MAYEGVDVVHDASMTLRPGEVTVLVGPNGSGKSTLLRTLARLQRARTARIVIDGDTDGLALGPVTSRATSPCSPRGAPRPAG
ncbi:iron-dicitrate transporter ATP-binding subunit [Streptomyces alboflavus]|uniref:Iron-dicitrate transporter ATP-binding subunit n=1 Tax=Streptomyces alboflavus TaxID=67267 RepID=A0A1Z1WQ34_9ACTN|nr:iron-dicitrate transporter ATP-binding subunit [Streptomyces alboflavus]